MSNKINEKYAQSIKVIDELDNLILLLEQLINIKKSLNSNDVTNINAIRNLLNEIEQSSNELSKNYFSSLPIINNQIIKFHEQTQTMLEAVSSELTLKIYNERLLMFANKYRQEAEQINENVALAEKYYRNKEFVKSLDLLIDTLNTIKNSAKFNKVPFK